MSVDTTIDYASCIKKLYPTIADSDFELKMNEEGLTLLWYNEATFGASPTFDTLAGQWLAVVKKKALAQILVIRQNGLNLAAQCAGVLAIYQANYNAAVSFLAGDTTEVTPNGMNVTDYLAGFGARLGMTATQFANYIISSNQTVGQTAYNVESRYLALTYGGDSAHGIIPVNYMTTVSQIQTAVEAFESYCGLPPLMEPLF